MRKKITLVLILILGFSWFAWEFGINDESQNKNTYQLAILQVGDLESTVSATGTLSARVNVEVGTQVSGTIAKVYVDFNDLVEKGQLLALIDPENLDAAIREAEAGIAKAKAQHLQAGAQVQAQKVKLAEAQSVYDRNLPLYERGYLSEAEFQPMVSALASAEAQLNVQQANVTLAKASIESAEASLDRALKSRKNAEIRSPISGVVVSRDVNEGQTVAASLSAPTLFVIAENLVQMEILVNVDESDIGQIQPGQPARFTVASHPDQTFEGVAQEIRLQPTTISNVVNYTVVVDVTNECDLLLPGMTATVDFVTERVEDALIVPTQALNIRPTSDMLANMQGEDSSGRTRSRGEEDRGSKRTQDGEPGTVKSIWYISDSNSLEVAAVKVGATDGFTTEVIPIRNEIEPGTQIIIGIDGASERQSIELTPSPFGGPRRGMPRGI